MGQVGTPILDSGDTTRVVSSDAIDAEQAAAVVLATYLRSLEFIVNGRAGERLVPRERFKLRQVYPEWPDPNVSLEYPSASLSAPIAVLGRHALTHTVCADTWGRYDDGKGRTRTVLWKLGELEADFQIDLWANDDAHREAMLARMPGAFAPGEDWDRVLLRGTPLYWCLPVRAHLISHERIDTPGALVSNEYRARLRVRTEVAIVELRCATLLDVRAHLTADEMIEIAESI